MVDQETFIHRDLYHELMVGRRSSDSKKDLSPQPNFEQYTTTLHISKVAITERNKQKSY